MTKWSSTAARSGRPRGLRNTECAVPGSRERPGREGWGLAEPSVRGPVLTRVRIPAVILAQAAEGSESPGWNFPGAGRTGRTRSFHEPGCGQKGPKRKGGAGKTCRRQGRQDKDRKAEGHRRKRGPEREGAEAKDEAGGRGRAACAGRAGGPGQRRRARRRPGGPQTALPAEAVLADRLAVLARRRPAQGVVSHHQP